MEEKIKEVELVNGKQLFRELKHFIHKWFDTITVKIRGTITPIEIRSSSDFREIDLFEIKAVYCPSDFYRPTYEILREELWCPALKQEIINYLERLLQDYNHMDPKLFKLAISYIITQLRREGKTKKLSLPQKAELIGRLEVTRDFYDLNIVGDVLLANGEQKQVEFLKLENLFRIWSPFSDPTTKILRKNPELWTQALTNLIISLLIEIKDFTNPQYKEDIQRAERVLRDKSKKAKFCNQLHDGLLKTDDRVLYNPQLLKAFKTIAAICDFKLDPDLLVMT